MKRALKIAVACALYEVVADAGECSYDRLAPTAKNIYEEQAEAAYKVIRAAIKTAERAP